MPQFWRLVDNRRYVAGLTYNLGFPIESPLYIPDEYLEQKKFVVFRTCFGLGDWGIISAFPRKLKEKYPDCEVYVPTPKLIKSMFGSLEKNWDSWVNPFEVSKGIFDNNPYVDGFIDSFEGEVYHDHFRIYDGDKDEPLLQQMMRFWQFDNFDDIEPEVYFSAQEEELAQHYIDTYTTDGKFGTLLVSNRWETEDPEKIQMILDDKDLPIFHFESKDVGLKYNGVLDMREVPTRVQLLLKTKAQFNVGNQTGVHDTIANYRPTYTVKRRKLGSNFIRSQIYI